MSITETYLYYIYGDLIAIVEFRFWSSNKCHMESVCIIFSLVSFELSCCFQCNQLWWGPESIPVGLDVLNKMSIKLLGNLLKDIEFKTGILLTFQEQNLY